MAKCLLLFAAAAALCLGADPFVGTWKPTELDKWKNTSLPDAQKILLRIEAVGADLHRVTFIPMEPGITVPNPETNILDGVERIQPTAGAPDRTVKRQRIDNHHVRNTTSSSKGRGVEDTTVSPDGKTLTLRRTGTRTSTGQPLDDFLIYAKQDK